MKIKWFFIIIAFIFLTVEGFTHGKMSGFITKIISPYSENIIGRTLCSVGGFIANPLTNVGGHHLPIILTSDDIIVGSLLSMFFTWYIFKRFIQSTKRLIILAIVLLLVFAYLYRYVGMVMIYFAEKTYGMSGCGVELPLGAGMSLQYSWYNPLFYVMGIFAVITFAGMIIKIKKKV